LRNYYRNHLYNLEVLCFQEHELKGAKLAALGGRMWRDAKFFGQEANVAYKNTADSIGAGSGGICMWISPHIQDMIRETGYIRSGRAQWIRLSSLPRRDLALLNVYAPNSSPKRCKLWAELTNSLPINCQWIFCGNWNFVEFGQIQTADVSNDNR
jgi:hypothetical protein